MTNLDQRITYLSSQIEQRDNEIATSTRQANYHRFNFNTLDNEIATIRKHRSLLKHQLLIARLRRWFTQLTKW